MNNPTDHEVEHQLPQGDCREEHKEESEYKHTILTYGGFENQRESIDGSLNYERVPIDGCSQLYVGDIRSYLKMLLQDKFLIRMKTKTL